VILVTGATGFVGQEVVKNLIITGHDVRACARQDGIVFHPNAHIFKVGNLSENTDWHSALQNLDVVIHLAARVHVMTEHTSGSLTEFRKVNTAATLNLARQAIDAGVKRFVFISSIKVNGEDTNNGLKFSPNDIHVPTDPYGLSKYEAEQGLLKLAEETNMEVVIIRSPLVYGVGVRANFLSMMQWVNKGIPLPFGSIHNKRSLVALDNLVSFIIHCIEHPKAANEVFLISDGEDVSTTELLQQVAKAFGKKIFLLPVPVGLMRFFAKLLGKEDVANRLFGSLQVDSSKARDLLDWKPVITMDEQLKKIADVFARNKNT